MEQIVVKFQIDFTQSMQAITMLDEQINKMAIDMGDSGYKSELAEKLNEHMAEVTKKTATLAYPILKDMWTSRIQGGQVTPSLSAKTLAVKTLQGYSEAPLYRTGELSENFGLGDITDDSIEFITDSNVLPSWHGASLYVAPTLAEGVPIRQVFNEQEVNAIFYEQFYIAYETIDVGEKTPMPEKVTFSVSSNVSVTSSDAAGNDKLKKKKNKKLKTLSSKARQVNSSRKTTAKKNKKLTGRG